MICRLRKFLGAEVEEVPWLPDNYRPPVYAVTETPLKGQYGRSLQQLVPLQPCFTEDWVTPDHIRTCCYSDKHLRQAICTENVLFGLRCSIYDELALLPLNL